MDLYTVRNKIISGTPIHNLNLKVTFYARVSTDKDGQLHSLSSQISYFKEYIQKINSWELVDGYVDEGISGTIVKKRDAFLKMIEDAKKGMFDLILTKEISRFSRNTLDSIKYTSELLQSGVAVYFLNDNINTILPDSELRLTIMASIAQDEVRKLSERVRFGMQRSIEKGIVLGGSNIYGYIKENGRLTINEREASMIKYIYDQYANNNISLNALSQKLYEHGFTNKYGKKIDITIIKRIITNPKYKGYYCGNKTKIVDYQTKKKKTLNEKDWVIYKDEKNVPAIVSEELWGKANKKLSEMIKSYKNKKIDKTIFHNRYPYSGKIYCAIHNKTYHRNGSKTRKDNPTWECQMYRKKGKVGCSNSKIFEKEIDKFFLKLFNDLIDNNLIDSIIKEYEDYLSKYNINKNITFLEKKHQSIILKKSHLLNLFIEENITKDEFLNKNSNLSNELRKIEKELYNLQNNNITNIDYLENIKKELQIIKNNNLIFNDLFNLLIEKIIVYQTLNIKHKIKLKIIFKTGETIYILSDSKGHNFILYQSNENKCVIS